MIPYAGMNAATRALNTTDKWRRRTRRLEKLLYRAYDSMGRCDIGTQIDLLDDIRHALDEKPGRTGPKRK